jgi:predicted Fe-Mo cluster-binding NifX family protein
MKRKIAVPIDENGILDAHFGHCKFFELFDVADDKIIDEMKVIPPPHQPGVLPKWLADEGATDIIAGGMGQMAIQIFNKNGVNVFVGAERVSGKQLVESFLKGDLQLLSNYCDH